jgi:hypothetical protein
MALDRFMTWTDKKPAEGELQTLLEDYLGEAGTVVEQGGRLYATFSSPPSSAFRRAVPQNPGRLYSGERWFEVIPGDNGVDICTRNQDEFTNALAKGYYNIVARFYNAVREGD